MNGGSKTWETKGSDRPSFIGIGPPKCATTWLDTELRRHPQVFLPQNCKEVFYFDRFFERGEDWYLKIFSEASDANVLGEISTSYISSPLALQRIQRFDPEMKIVCVLRHPVERMISHYRMFVENGRTTACFEDAVEEQEALRENSSYRTLLESVFEYFRPEQVHIGIYESIFSTPDARSNYLSALIEFLGADPDLLPPAAETKKIRETFGAPKSRWAVKKAKAVRSALRDRDMDGVVRFLEKAGVDRSTFLKKATPPKILPTTRQRLIVEFEEDIAAVETLTGTHLAVWRS